MNNLDSSNMLSKWMWTAWLLLTFAFALEGKAGNGALEMKNGYFWDPGAGGYFIPRGIAYQVWNPPVGANQSFEQLDYDLLEFKKMHCNSVRCEIVWGEVNTGDGKYDWSKPDYLIERAEKLGLKLFILVGFQYPPAWFPKAWRNVNYLGLTPGVIECLASSTPANALNCFPASTRECLSTNVPAEIMATVVNCLITGAKAGGLSNVVSCLETSLSAELLPKVLGCLISDVINYEHPQARAAYQKHISEVTRRYKDSRAVGAWILGNEYAYFDLWEDPNLYQIHRFIGYDGYSQSAFHNYLRSIYHGSISALNANWLTTYSNFEEVIMAPKYPDDRNNPGFHDLTQWRKQSIGDYVALGAAAARDSDPNHLKTYSMVGGIFNGRDANFTAEDARTIVTRCALTNAPLDFWAINNYANASLGSELRTGDFGIGKYQEESGLPVLISETGHSSTEELFDKPYAGLRQAKALPGQIWESLVSGSIGTHIFHWNDRSQFTRNYFLRERGFGIVEQNRKPKEPVFTNVADMFRRMESIQIENLLGGSVNPRADIQFLWSTNSDMVWPRANQEIAMMWGALKRVGYQVDIIGDEAFDRGAYTNASALLLSRCYQLRPDQLDTLANKVIPAGIHVHADADLPGRFNAYHHYNTNWAARMDSIFGVDSANAYEGFHAIVTNDNYQAITFKGLNTLGPVLVPKYNATVKTWEIWHGITVTSGKTIVTHSGFEQTQNNPPVPALVIKSNGPGQGKSALNTFALGDTYLDEGMHKEPLWDFRYDWLSAIYRTHFGMKPPVELTGTLAKYVMPDYRVCRNGSILLSLLNESTNNVQVTLTAHALLNGKTVENITGGGIVETNSDGVLSFTMTGDDYILLYAYDRRAGLDASLINPSTSKVWYETAPAMVRPTGNTWNLSVGYDAADTNLEIVSSFERIGSVSKVYGQSAASAITGRGQKTLALMIPDPDFNDPNYISTADGGRYVFRVWLAKNGVRLSETILPVRLAWGVRPLSLPKTTIAGRNYDISVEWEDIPSYATDDVTPASRAALWDSLYAKSLYFNVILELRGPNGGIITAATNVTTAGSGTNQFSITVPANASGPFTWAASLQSAPDTVSLDICDSFEGRDRGLDRTPMYPWFNYSYAEFNNAAVLSEGVLWEPARQSKVAYLVVANPANPGGYSGFGIVQGTTPWALPTDSTLLSNFVFKCDFKEKNGYDCLLEFQIKDVNGKSMEFTKPYQPNALGWDTITASLDKFSVPPDQVSSFDRTHIKDWFVNIRMLRKDAIYEAYFDNVRFKGPPDLDDDFEDRLEGENFSRQAPWQPYGYDEPNHNDVLLDKGVHLIGSDGSQSAFIVAWNRIDSGNFAGFGLFKNFDSEWTLPADRREWKNYSFSFDFMERDRRPCLLELQLKNKNDPSCPQLQKGIHFTKTYMPDEKGWDTISATLDQFSQPDFFCAFDPAKVFSLVLNVQMLDKSPTENVLYVASIDNIQFNAPDKLAPGKDTLSVFTTANDFFGFIGIENVEADKLVIEWTGGGVLQWSDTVDGRWHDIPEAVTPFTTQSDQQRRFFRLRR